VNDRLDGVSAMLTLSVARTRIVYVSSAGKFEAGKVYDQLPPESEVVFQTSEALPKDEPFQ
jgi:hypothetical protein